uniref:Uncharacterized protein n=1 Tax=Romanomermis culicivorax TaxID=13658 RepID=A0A915I942_ROMCU
MWNECCRDTTKDVSLTNYLIREYPILTCCIHLRRDKKSIDHGEIGSTFRRNARMIKNNMLIMSCDQHT